MMCYIELLEYRPWIEINLSCQSRKMPPPSHCHVTLQWLAAPRHSVTFQKQVAATGLRSCCSIALLFANVLFPPHSDTVGVKKTPELPVKLSHYKGYFIILSR